MAVEEVLIGMFESNRTLLRVVSSQYIDAFVQQLVDARPGPHPRSDLASLPVLYLPVWVFQTVELSANSVCASERDNPSQPGPCG
jgi:hypothetical protein